MSDLAYKVHLTNRTDVQLSLTFKGFFFLQVMRACEIHMCK